MKYSQACAGLITAALATTTTAFTTTTTTRRVTTATIQSNQIQPTNNFLLLNSILRDGDEFNNNDIIDEVKCNDPSRTSQSERRAFLQSLVLGTSQSVLAMTLLNTPTVNAQVPFDPAMYGDQELRIGAVDSVKESVRRAILQNPQLAPSFYQLALMDGLSYNAETQQFGPDGRIIINVLNSKEQDPYTLNLREAALALIATEQKLRKKVQISLADAIAIGGAESIESIGGPLLTVQLGRPDTPKDGMLSPVPLNLFSGTRPVGDVIEAFRKSGMTEREATALIAGMLTLERVEKTRTSEDWRQSTKPKFREPGKMGRMSEFRPLTEEDIAQAELDEELGVDPDDGWYIADSFGTKDDRFGQRLAKDEINEKNFNKYLKELVGVSNTAGSKKKTSTANLDDFGWTAAVLLDSNYPTIATWVNKYAGANLNFLKDLSIAYNSVTQLGAVYTGGKYESLLKNKPRRSLNDDDLKLF